jgi:hypothetical protein
MVSMIFGNQKCLDVLLWSCGKIEFAGSDNILEVWLSIQQEHIEKKRKEEATSSSREIR